jgi:hypothetical protein
MIQIKKFKTHALLTILACTVCLTTSCEDEDSYAELRKTEHAQIKNFINNGTTVIEKETGDTILHVAPIKVISEATFYENDSTTNVKDNEYVVFNGSGVYMQIVRQGSGKRLENQETTSVVCRYTEFNISADSIQSSNDNSANDEIYRDIMSVTKNYGTITATFLPSGKMYSIYGTSVPSGWILPLQFVNLGRYVAETDIAKVRIIVPSTEGQSDAMSNVYPCFYEITYMRGDR